MNHEIVIYRFDSVTQTYRRYRSEWVSEGELNNLKRFISNNQQVEGLYRYIIDGTPFASLHPDLIQWVNYLAMRLKLPAISENNINIIEQ